MAGGPVGGCRIPDIGVRGKLCAVFPEEGLQDSDKRAEGEKCLGQGLWQRDFEGLDTGVYRV